MTQAQLRLARPEDLPAAVQLYQRTRDQMLTRNNLGPPGEDPAAAQEGFRHVLETGIFYVAEMEDGLAGICHAVVRDQIWFLSGFWVAEALQRQGIGGPLLRKVWAEGEARGATIFCVWSSVDPTAMAFYMKLGMLPGTPILNFGSDSLALPPKPDEPPGHSIRLQGRHALPGELPLPDHRPLWAAGAVRPLRAPSAIGRPQGVEQAPRPARLPPRTAGSVRAKTGSHGDSPSCSGILRSRARP